MGTVAYKYHHVPFINCAVTKTLVYKKSVLRNLDKLATPNPHRPIPRDNSQVVLFC